MPAFRIDSAQFFLTYPQSGLDLDYAFERLKIRDVQDTVPIQVVIAEEVHADGNKHHHAYLKYPKKLCIRDCNVFDIDNAHCNVQSARSAKRVIQYCVKEGNFRSFGVEVKIKREAGLKRLLEEVSEPEEFLSKVTKLDPEWALSRFTSLRAFAEWRFRDGNRVFEAQRPLSSFHGIPTEVEEWRVSIRSHVVGERDMRSMWMYGTTRLGKTALARSLGHHAYMQGIWNMACLDDRAMYTVFDDIEFESIRYIYKQLFGMQKDVNFTGKYRRPTHFTWGMPIIFLSNELPVFDCPTYEWMQSNVIFVEIKCRLF